MCSINLNDLNINQKGIVKCINCTEKIKRRLYDLGLLENTPITYIFSSPLGDPKAYEFRGNIIAIRNDDAEKISIETSNKEG